MATRAISPPTHTTTPSQVQAERVDGVLVARRPGGVAGEGEDDDRGEGQDGEPRHRATAASRAAAEAATTTATRALMSRTRVVSRVHANDTSWVEQVGAGQRRARERGEGQHDLEERGDRPDARRRRRRIRVAVTRRSVLVRSGTRNAASPSSPTVALAARVLTVETSGQPPAHQRPGVGEGEGGRRAGEHRATTATSSHDGPRPPAADPERPRERRGLGGGHAHQRRYCGGMPVHPPAPSDLGAVVDAYAQTVRSVIDLGRTMRPGDEALPTDCPGWTVLDQVAHVASTEAMVAGEPEPDVDVSHHTHVRHAFGERIERYVESRRGREPRARCSTSSRSGSRSGCASTARAPSGPTARSPGRSATRRWARCSRCASSTSGSTSRTSARPCGRPGGLDTPARRAHRGPALRRAAPHRGPARPRIEPGNAVVLDLTGPTVGRAGARVEEQDGKAVGMPLFTGGHEEHPDVVTTSLTMSTQVAGRLAGGRRAPEDVHVVVHGDEDVARRVLASLAITP